MAGAVGTLKLGLGHVRELIDATPGQLSPPGNPVGKVSCCVWLLLLLPQPQYFSEAVLEPQHFKQQCTVNSAAEQLDLAQTQVYNRAN